MGHKFELTRELCERIAQLATDLRVEVDEHREAYGEASERWQEGDRGVATDGWLDELDGLVDQLDGVEDHPDA